jgi:glutamyl-tRNA synthetase
MICSDPEKSSLSPVITRFAPSPTGSLHIGGARTALFNYLWAKHNGGTFLLRFEDTDKARSSTQYETAIFEDLRWLGISPDEEPVRQTSRRARHAEILDRMIKDGLVYPCFCPENGAHITAGVHRCREMPEDERNRKLSSGEARCWRFKVARGRVFTYTDRLRGEISVPADAIEDFSLARSDGSATYLLAAAVDDHDYHITHVIRGEEHLSNVPKQEMIYRAMRWNVPEWVHIPMILDHGRHKLSKRSGAISIGQYREDGWSPEAVVSYLSTLSWSEAPADRIVSMDELAGMFDIGSVARFSPVHDEGRMTHFGKIFMSNVPDKELLEWCGDSFGTVPGGLIPDAEKLSLIRELLDSCATPAELAGGVRRELSWSRQDFAASAIPPWLTALSDRLAVIGDDEWRAFKIKDVMKDFARENGLKGRELFHPVRILLTGSPRGAPIAVILSCVGKEQYLKRLEYYLRREDS